MPRYRVNFGAAAIAALIPLACGPNSSTPRTEAAAAPTAASQPANTVATPDPKVTAADRGRIAGDTAAKTWFIIVSDFQCPYCKQWHDETYHALVDEYVRPGKLKVAYINFPLGQHENAVPTAEAAMCAGAQQKFWEYHDALFTSQRQWAAMPNPSAHLEQLARNVGVNFDEWRKCVDSDKMLPMILADRDRAAAGGVQSTPSFLIGGEVIAGAQTLEALRPVIEAAIAKSGTAPPR